MFQTIEFRTPSVIFGMDTASRIGKEAKAPWRPSRPNRHWASGQGGRFAGESHRQPEE
jgi:hypothetical protein